MRERLERDVLYLVPRLLAEPEAICRTDGCGGEVKTFAGTFMGLCDACVMHSAATYPWSNLLRSYRNGSLVSLRRYRVRCVPKRGGGKRTVFVYAAVLSQSVVRAKAMLRDDFGRDPDNYEFESSEVKR